MAVAVFPKEEHKQRLIQNLGRDYWVYEGQPEKGYVLNNGRVIAVWFFEWNKIPKDVQNAFVRGRVRSHNVSPVAARAWLEGRQQAIPQSHITLKESE